MTPLARGRRFLASPAGRALIALALVLILGTIFNADGAFFKMGTHRDTLRQASVYGMLACGLTLVIVSGGIDLAVGSVLALVAVASARMGIQWGWSGWVVAPASLALGAACGGVAGVVTARLRVQPFIATLSMMALARGLARYVSGGMKVSTAVKASDGTYHNVSLPPLFTGIDTRILGGNVSMVTVIFGLCVAVAWVALARHRWGRYLHAMGGTKKPPACRVCRSWPPRFALTPRREGWPPWPASARRRRSNRAIPRRGPATS